MAPTGGRRAAAMAATAALSSAVKRTIRKKRLKDNTKQNNSNRDNRITNQNIYMDLEDDDESSGLEEESVTKKPRKNTPKLPPPITIQSHTIAELKKSIESNKDITFCTKEISYKITQVGVKIYTPNSEIFKKVKKHCEDHQMQGFTHTAADDRYVKICLYGLWNMPLPDVMAELKSNGIEPVDIKQLTLNNRRYTDQAIYLLYFRRKQHMTVEQLKSVRGLFNVIVDFRYYRNRSKEPTQCEICLQFGHGKSNCFGKPAVCFRCAGQHSGSKCPFLKPATKENERPRIDEKLVQCALCKKRVTLPPIATASPERSIKKCNNP